METLDHEKFQALKELAEIQGKIAEGSALLANLESHKEEFLAIRAKELELRLNQALHDAKGTITEINQYHDELVKYRKQTDSYVESLRYFSELVMGISNSLNLDIHNIISFLDVTEKEFEEVRKEIKRGLAEVKDGEKALKSKQAIFKEEEIKLKDGQATLERAIKRLEQGRV